MKLDITIIMLIACHIQANRNPQGPCSTTNATSSIVSLGPWDVTIPYRTGPSWTLSLLLEAFSTCREDEYATRVAVCLRGKNTDRDVALTLQGYCKEHPVGREYSIMGINTNDLMLTEISYLYLGHRDTNRSIH